VSPRNKTLLAVSPIALLAAPVLTGCRHSRVFEGPLLHATVSIGRRSMPYAVYLPPGYSEAKAWPVILFLHGFGERGDDGVSQTRGICAFLRRNADRFPCLVVMPQMPRAYVRWSGVMNDMALKALDEVVRKYHGDRQRLYLTGCSMGGGGCWRMAALHPDRFAAVTPLCGHTDPAAQAPALRSLPIWAFHGAADPLVPVRYSRAMVNAIRAEGNTRIRYTEYPGVHHNCWDRTYSDPKVIAWLLAQRRSSVDASVSEALRVRIAHRNTAITSTRLGSMP
jgi:predicted peptidase